ncbi:hypothetical protein V5G20_17960 [Brevibacillus borstelensis]|uniref:hypothetical protein n=1 Tax=Brevibacillus borstelensis TaxID=45462 RepID=UPI0030D207BB
MMNPKHTGHSDGTKVQLVTDYGKVGFANPDQLVKAIEEAQPLKVGDYAKVVEPTAGFSAKGQIVKITKVDDSDIPYNTQGMDGKYTGWYEATDLVRATDEEVAEAKRKLEEKRRLHELEAKWHAIGRKVGEFKRGDVVKTLQEVGGHPVGTIGVIAKWEPDHSHLIEANGETYFHMALELIAPVESVVNLHGGDVA